MEIYYGPMRLSKGGATLNFHTPHSRKACLENGQGSESAVGGQIYRQGYNFLACTRGVRIMPLKHASLHGCNKKIAGSNISSLESYPNTELPPEISPTL